MYYIQISEDNLINYFLQKGFIFPSKIGEVKYDDLFKKIPEYVPLVNHKILGSYDKKILKNNDSGDNYIIYLEIDKNNLEPEKIIEINDSIKGYSGIIPFSKINNIYIKDENRYVNFIRNIEQDTKISKEILDIIKNSDIILEEINIDKLNKKTFNKKNEYINDIEKNLIEEQRRLGGFVLLLKIFEFEGDKNIYKNIINYFKSKIDNLDFLYLSKYNNGDNEYKKLKESIDLIIKNHYKKDDYLKTNDYLNYIKKHIDKKDEFKKVFIDEIGSKMGFIETYRYNLEIYLMLLLALYNDTQENTIQDLYNSYISKIEDTKTKILFIYIYGEIIGYSSFFNKNEINGKTFTLRLGRNDFEKDLYNGYFEKEVISNIKQIKEGVEFIEIDCSDSYGKFKIEDIKYINKNNVHSS